MSSPPEVKLSSNGTTPVATVPRRRLSIAVLPDGERLRRIREQRRFSLVLLAIIAVALVWAILGSGAIAAIHVRTTYLTSNQAPPIELLQALLAIFSALILFLLYPPASEGRVYRWLALGILIFGVGQLGVRAGVAAMDLSVDFNRAIAATWLVRLMGALVIAIAFVPASPPRLTRRLTILIPALTLLGTALILRTLHAIPRLTDIPDGTPRTQPDFLSAAHLTATYWIIGWIPALLLLIAVVGALSTPAIRAQNRWIPIGVTLIAAAQMHRTVWPINFTDDVTTASLFRFTGMVFLAIGAVHEMRVMADDRDSALAAERSYRRRLEELSALRSDFTRIVAHELGSPVAAIQRSVEVVALDPVSARQQQALTTVSNQTSILVRLIADVQESAIAERTSFTIDRAEVPIADLIGEAASHAHSLMRDRTVEVVDGAPGSVIADPGRISQVLYNLVSNAHRYSTPGQPVSISAQPAGSHVRFAVTDSGPGIHPDDLIRVFEKFGRGRHTHHNGDNGAGLGLGLYLSRRILTESGSELLVQTGPGLPTTFWFDLERCA